MNTPAVTAPYFAAVLVLGLAGLAKVAKPNDTARALLAAGLRLTRRSVRLGAAVEVGIAVAALAAPGVVTASLVAGSYAGFAAFIVLALRRGWAIASCGCFGRPDTPPTVAHASLDVAAAASAVWWAAAGPSRMGPVFSHQPWHGVPLVLLTVLVATLAYMVWTNPLPGTSR